MSSKVWLLVEWVDESNVFTVYDVVSVDPMTYDEKDLYPGNLIYISVKHGNPRKAKILRISDSKHYVKEHKDILERQDQQVKNVLQLCMRTIKELKADHVYNTQQNTSSHNYSLSQVVVAKNDNSGSDSDSEPNNQYNRSQNSNKFHAKFPSHNSRPSQQNGPHQRSSLNAHQRRYSMISSTPLPSTMAQKNIKLSFDQATQTEGTYLEPPIQKIEEMEGVLKNLYRRFQCLISQVNHNANGSTSMSESEHNDDISFVEPNIGESWAENNNTNQIEEDNIIAAQNNGDIGAEVNNREKLVYVMSNAETQDKGKPNALHVRRMSAQTTNNIEALSPNIDLVPIGNGNAKVPARLLHDMDWNSHTSATRQLLQAVFPRKILATHSLTGKQSPAFMHKPPKKILDPKLVDDIVKTVSTRCGVPKNLVRNSITIKCTDEAKLYRNRQRYKHAIKSSHQNEENISPCTPSSDESAHVMN